MAKKYVKIDANSDDVYCACGCGQILTKMQRYKNGKYASKECALKMRLLMLNKEHESWKAKHQCLCGCGELISIKDFNRGFPFVNKEHEKKYKFDMYEKEELEKKKEIEKSFKKYCVNYDPTITKCISCYEDGAGMYRGCYGKPKSKK